MFPLTTQILIVEDMVSLRELLKSNLRQLGYKHIAEAADGREAYQAMIATKASGKSFDLVISDWNMPVVTGLELLKLVRSIPDWKDLPFLLLTTENEKAKVMEAVMAKVSNYMVKPVTAQTLEEKLLRTWQKLNQPLK